MKKWTSLLLALVMMLSCVSIPAFAEEKPTLTVWITEDLRIEDFETNAQTLYIEEQLGVDLKMVVQPSSDFQTKVNMALTIGAVEDLPDIITGLKMSDANIWEWAQAETIIPLTDYYNNPELAVHLNKAIERTGTNYPQQIVSPDGNLYALGYMNQSYANEYPAKFWIYKPWLDAIGMEMPTTTEELYQVYKKVKETDLNGNGKPDEIPMLGSAEGSTYDQYLQVLMNAFTYMGDAQYRYVKDGVVTAAYASEEWKNGLKYIKRMFDEGLIPVESLTMADAQFETLMAGEEAVVFSMVYYSPNAAGMPRKYDYTPVGALKGPEGVQFATFVPTTAMARFVITANCKYPELAFKVGDLLSSEYVSIMERFGVEGVDWDYAANVENLENYVPLVPGSEPYIVCYDDATFWSGTGVANASWRQKGPYIRQYAIGNGTCHPVKDEGVVGRTDGINEHVLYQESGWAPDEVIPKLIYTSDESDAISEIEANLKVFVDESLGKFVTGAKDIDAEWDNYLAELDKIGLETYLEVAQNVYDRMYK